MTLYFSQWPGTQRMATHHRSQPLIHPIWILPFPVRLVFVLDQVCLSCDLLLLCCPSWVCLESHCAFSCSSLCVCSQYAKMCLAPRSPVLYLGPSTCSYHLNVGDPRASSQFSAGKKQDLSVMVVPFP